jgi:hypothetical protein
LVLDYGVNITSHMIARRALYISQISFYRQSDDAHLANQSSELIQR